MTAREMFEELGYLLEAHNEYTIKYSKEECDYTTFDFNLKNKKIYSRFMSAAHGITLDELKAVIRQAKELGWLEEEKQEIKQETNFEHYKDEIIEGWMLDLALVDGKLKRCSCVDCNECEFNPGANKGCKQRLIEWVKMPYEKPKYKLNRFEYDLLNAYKNSGMRQCISNYGTLLEMYGKGHFKGIDTSTPIHEILDNCKVV